VTTIDQYKAAFRLEQTVKYPSVDQIVERYGGHELDYKFVLEAASVLACPVKKNPPNWQHGRVIYAVLRSYVEKMKNQSLFMCLDIGTAKGYSALCAARALKDAGRAGLVWSVDVLDPMLKTKRNSIADVTRGPTTVRQLISGWTDLSHMITLEACSGVEWLKRSQDRVHFAFIDGKHSYEAVSEELRLLAKRQQKDDVVIADDLQVPGVEKAVAECGSYRAAIVPVLPNRRHAILRRK